MLYEFIISFHQHCNLHCKFCFQKHPESIKFNGNELKKHIKKKLQYLRPKYEGINLIFMGGELFSDDIPDDIFEEYQYFIQEIQQYANSIGITKIQSSFSSNGIFTKYHRILSLLEETSSSLALSYDPLDRFSKEEQKEIWWNTFQYFYKKRKILCVSLTLTKKWEAYRKDPYIASIPNDVGIDLNLYIANKNYSSYLLTDQDIYDSYMYFIKNKKFNIFSIRDLLDSFLYKEGKEHCYCDECSYFDNHRFDIKDCQKKYSLLDKKYFYGDLFITEENCSKIKRQLGIQKRGCYVCEHFSYCPKFCWLSILFQEYKPSLICPNKKIYQYLDQHSDIIEEYKNFNKCYEEDIYGNSIRTHRTTNHLTSTLQSTL